MVSYYLGRINWVDVFVLILLIRISYIALKTGFSTEVFKLLGIVCAIYLACHYYFRIGSFLGNRLSLESAAGKTFLNFLVFSILAFAGYFVFVIVRVAFGVLIRIEAISLLNRWGAVLLGIGRCAIFASLLFFIFNISGVDYLKKSVADSYLGSRLFNLTPKVYEYLWNGLMCRFLDKEAFNEEVLKAGQFSK